ncbi:hypothetical protein RFI_31850, partial [Reticulomyxa filosa]
QFVVFNGHNNGVRSVKYGSDELIKIILSGSEDTSVRLWDIRSGQQTQAFNGHTDYIYAVEYSPFEVNCNEISGSSNMIYSGSLDNTIRFWDIRTNKKELHVIKGRNQDGILCLKLKRNRKSSNKHKIKYVCVRQFNLESQEILRLKETFPFLEVREYTFESSNYMLILSCRYVGDIMHRVFILYWYRAELVVASVSSCQVLFFTVPSLSMLLYSTGIFFWLKRLSPASYTYACLCMYRAQNMYQLNEKGVYWTCRRASVLFSVSSAIGIGGVSTLNITIDYMYVTRMIQTARAVHRNEELDLAHIKGNSSNHEISKETMKTLVHVKKCFIIALSSFTFAENIFSFVLVIVANRLKYC